MRNADFRVRIEKQSQFLNPHSAIKMISASLSLFPFSFFVYDAVVHASRLLEAGEDDSCPRLTICWNIKL